MTDVTGLGSVVSGAAKLAEVFSSHVHAEREPARIMERAKAAASAAEIAAVGDRRAQLIRVQGDLEAAALLEQAVRRLGSIELEHQRNLNAVHQIVAKELPEAVSARPVDRTWINQAMEGAQTVSDPALREFWGRLIAGEIKEPGSFSLRTLECLRTLTKGEAEMFGRLVPYVFTATSVTHLGLFPHHGNPAGNRLAQDGLSAIELETLYDAGLVASSTRTLRVQAGVALHYFGREYRIGPSARMDFADVQLRALTRAGTELSTVTSSTELDQYASLLSRSFNDFPIGPHGDSVA